MSLVGLPTRAPRALDQRVILVSGAHGGLGSAAAVACARAGATVVLLGRKLPKLNRVYDAVAQAGAEPLLYPLDLLRASGVARSMNFVSNAMALTVFALSGQVAWVLGIGMGLALMAGAYLGARSAIGGGARLIRPLFILMVLALSARLAWQHWSIGN